MPHRSAGIRFHFGGQRLLSPVGPITPSGTVSFLALPWGVDPGAITTGPDGNL
jgi:hypothetical protein